MIRLLLIVALSPIAVLGLGYLALVAGGGIHRGERR